MCSIFLFIKVKLGVSIKQEKTIFILPTTARQLFWTMGIIQVPPYRFPHPLPPPLSSSSLFPSSYIFSIFTTVHVLIMQHNQTLICSSSKSTHSRLISMDTDSIETSEVRMSPVGQNPDNNPIRRRVLSRHRNRERLCGSNSCSTVCIATATPICSTLSLIRDSR